MEDKNKEQLQKWYSIAWYQKSEPKEDWSLLSREADKTSKLPTWQKEYQHSFNN